jgi:hypothetical protein
MADAAEEPVPPSALALLPHAVVLLIFAQLPVDLRARCACVCRGWRATLSERSLWTRLDLSRMSGVTAALTGALLRGAAARAGGGLQVLDVCGNFEDSFDALLEVATANAGALCEMRVTDGTRDLTAVHHWERGGAEALLRAAPQLRVLDADVECDSLEDACRALRAEGLLAPLRVRRLRVHHQDAAEADVLALAADVAAHAWLQQLSLNVPLPTHAALDAVVDAALMRRLTALQFADCRLTPASAPALARLLGGGAIAQLHLWGHGDAADAASLLDAPAATLLAGALRANSTLTSLQLSHVNLWRDAEASATLLGALTAHPSLRTLSLCYEDVQEANRVAAGAALRVLLAANAPALTELHVIFCNLRDAGMAPLFEALPANTHLRTLKCAANNITDAFAATVLLPAVRANGSLRSLRTGGHWPSAREAEAVVRGRAAPPGAR